MQQFLYQFILLLLFCWRKGHHVFVIIKVNTQCACDVKQANLIPSRHLLTPTTSLGVTKVLFRSRVCKSSYLSGNSILKVDTILWRSGCANGNGGTSFCSCCVSVLRIRTIFHLDPEFAGDTISGDFERDPDPASTKIQDPRSEK